MAKIVNHRISFNCDLFMTLKAPEDASTDDLQRIAKTVIRGCFSEEDQPLTDIPLRFGSRSDGGPFEIVCYVRDAGDGNQDDDDQVVLENFNVANVED